MGLAAASLGLEARVYLQQKKYDRAIELYLEQLTTGDPTAGPSLIITAAQALTNSPDILRPLAVNPRTQRVLTAFVISRRCQRWLEFETDNPNGSSQPAVESRRWQSVVGSRGSRRG